MLTDSRQDAVARMVEMALVTGADAVVGEREAPGEVRAIQAAADRSRWLLTSRDVERHLGIAYDVTVDMLAAATSVKATRLDRSAAETRTFPAGTAVVSTKQPLGGLANTLLEKQPAFSSGFVEEQLGGRHLASAAVTKETRAIAITVSETGVIRIFKDGEILMRIGTT